MVKVLISKQSNYPVSSPKIKKGLKEFFKTHGIVSDAEVSVAIVGEKKMLDLGKKYLNEGSGGSTKAHNVLSFPQERITSNGFVYPPNGVMQLGEIVVCYPKVIEEAKRENVLIDDKVYELVEHGALHLLGIHHK